MSEWQLVWGDRDEETVGQKAVDPDFKTRHWVKVDQVRMFDALATHWRERRVEIPNPRGLTQIVRHEHGGEIQVEICQAVFFDHLQRIAKRRRTERIRSDGIVVPEKTGRVRYYVTKLARAPSGSPRAPVMGAASDPHFAFAEMMNLVAWTRLADATWEPSVMWI